MVRDEALATHTVKRRPSISTRGAIDIRGHQHQPTNPMTPAKTGSSARGAIASWTCEGDAEIYGAERNAVCAPHA